MRLPVRPDDCSLMRQRQTRHQYFNFDFFATIALTTQGQPSSNFETSFNLSLSLAEPTYRLSGFAGNPIAKPIYIGFALAD